MNSTSNFDHNPSGHVKGYAYYSVGLSLGVLLVITVIIVASYCCSHRGLPSRQRSATARTSMELDSTLTIQVHQQEATVNSCPALLYSQVKLHKPDSTTSCCSICLADYNDTDWLRLLPDCGHLFHKDCVDMWLQQKLSCPVCRTSPLPTPLSTPLAEVAPLAARRG